MARCLALAASLLLLAVPAEAALRRATFFPKDLKMEEDGDVELDTRMGYLHAGDNSTVVVPDLALDIGVHRRLELDFDAQGGLDLTTGRWLAQDQLWISAKHLLWDDHSAQQAWALGLQQGPRFAVMPNTWGFGYQALALLGLRGPHWLGVVSLGGFIDPQDVDTWRRPVGALGGLNWSIDLNDVWDVAPSVALTWHGEGNVDVVCAADLERDLANWGSARVGVMAGWQDSGRIVGVAIGYAPRFRLWPK